VDRNGDDRDSARGRHTDVVERELGWLVRTKGTESNEWRCCWVFGAGQRGACMIQSGIANTNSDENRTWTKQVSDIQVVGEPRCGKLT
jgi:hypothetical protein